jgi:hypothetical protein
MADEAVHMNLEEIFAWRQTEKKKHRVMTWSEYTAWCRGGDSISHPSEANAFPGGLTILFDDTPFSIIGKTVAKQGNVP